MKRYHIGRNDVPSTVDVANPHPQDAVHPLSDRSLDSDSGHVGGHVGMWAMTIGPTIVASDGWHVRVLI
jgi:hypothetical protein